MIWVQFSFETTRDMVETCSDYLTELGAVSITLEDAKDQPLLEIYSGEKELLWDDVRIIALFEDTVDKEMIKKQLVDHFHTQISVVKETQIAEQDWQNAWKQYAKPLCFGRLWVYPTDIVPSSDHTLVVKLDPGLAFGTGSHPTTALCIEWLEQNVQGGETVIDFGCGSGILAISALKLGAKKAYAIDCDPQALITTKENCEKNDIASPSISFLLPEEISNQIQSNILMANILLEPLLTLKNTFSGLLATHGQLVLSGILATQVEQIIEHYQSDFDAFQINTKDEWARIFALKKSSV